MKATHRTRQLLEGFLRAALVGVCGGGVGLAFNSAMSVVQPRLLGGAAGANALEMVRALAWWQRLLLPAAGMLVAGLVLTLWTGRTKGGAFVSALSNNKDGFTTLLAVVAPNLPAKPDTLLFNKVTIKGAKQAVQLFGPAQAAVARAVVDSVAEGVIPKDQVDDLCIIVGVFIHWDAEDDKKIYDYNYEAVKMSIARAINGEPSIDKVLSETPAARHPFAGGAEG